LAVKKKGMEMNENDTVELWERLFAEYRGTEMCVLYMEALRKGLSKGSITAEDLHGIEVINPNIRGAVMRGLRRAGMFEKEAVAFGSTEASHGHVMFKWRLTKRVEASRILEKVAVHFNAIGKRNETEHQLTLC
jgi:hypothetical protein